MKLYLVRCAQAERRSAWAGPDKQRPLSDAGRRQAQGLLELLADVGVDRILASPALRCRETVAPLAARRRISLELDSRLASGARLERSVELLRSLREQAVVVCTHRPQILGLLEALVDEGDPADAEQRCEPASTWLLELPPVRASYLMPRTARTAAKRPGPAAAAPGSKSPRAARSDRVAVLDMGSTSFHMLVAELTREGAVKRIARKREMLRLGAELAQCDSFPEPVLERAVEAAGRLREFAEEEKAGELIPVGTAALREASNGRELCERLGDALGAPVWVMDGSQEARLIFLALRRRLELGPGLSLGLDLGGGSLELALGDRSEIVRETTLPIGVARLEGELVSPDAEGRIAKRDLKAVRKRVRQLLEPHRSRIATLSPQRCVGVGGTVRSLARLLTADRRGSSGRGLFASGDDLAEVGERLARISHDERLERRGMNPRRADLLPVGAVILAALTDELGFGGLSFCDWGLREGVVLEVLGH